MGNDGFVRNLDRARTAIGLLAVTFMASFVVFFSHYQNANEIADAEIDGDLEVLLLGLPILVLTGCALWLGETEFDADLRNRVV